MTTFSDRLAELHRSTKPLRDHFDRIGTLSKLFPPISSLPPAEPTRRARLVSDLKLTPFPDVSAGIREFYERQRPEPPVIVVNVHLSTPEAKEPNNE